MEFGTKPRKRKIMKKQQSCKLFPYKIEKVISIQEVKQNAGWNITAFDMPGTWNKTKGEGVKIAVIDSGVDLTHPDLANNLLPGINILDKSKPPIDDLNHGTHVTGIICAENNNIGVVGVAPAAKVIPVKIMDKKGMTTVEIACEGIRWAVDNKADIICMSFGTPAPHAALRRAIQYAYNKGIPCFVAAGNVGDTKEVFYPANYAETIAIGSIDESFNRSRFSNTGKNLDFMAPGNKILSTIPKNWYGIASGTSQATPFAAGVAALLLSYVRNNNTKIKLNTMEDFRIALGSQTIPINDKNYHSVFFQGFGIIDPRKLKCYLENIHN